MQTFDKVTTYSYGIPAIKVCESEMLSKNKLNMLDEDKYTPKDKNKDKTKTKTKTKAKTIHETKDNDEDIDKDNSIPKTIVKIEDKDMTMSEYKDEDMLTKVYTEDEKEHIDNNHWTKRITVKIFWNNNNISEICEKWIFYNGNYAYIRSEKLHTHLCELLYTREHKAGLSKKNLCTYIDIDELNMDSDGYDESLFKPKKEYRDMIDKVYDKMNNINDVITTIKKINDELKKNIESVREIIFKLPDDSLLTQVEVNTINAIIDDALNFVCNKICRKNI